MDLEYDPQKSAENAIKRNLPFESVVNLDWTQAIEFVDDRFDYGESRIVALVPMRDSRRLHIVCYVVRGMKRRIISFRKANYREAQIYDQAASDR